MPAKKKSRYTFSKRPHTINHIGDNINNNVSKIVLMRYFLILLDIRDEQYFQFFTDSGNIVDRMGAVHATFTYDYIVIITKNPTRLLSNKLLSNDRLRFSRYSIIWIKFYPNY